MSDLPTLMERFRRGPEVLAVAGGGLCAGSFPSFSGSSMIPAQPGWAPSDDSGPPSAVRLEHSHTAPGYAHALAVVHGWPTGTSPCAAGQPGPGGTA